jgi:hypothetical protein
MIPAAGQDPHNGLPVGLLWVHNWHPIAHERQKRPARRPLVRDPTPIWGDS